MFLKMHETFALFKDMHTDETFFGLGLWCIFIDSLCVRQSFQHNFRRENSYIE